MSNQIVLVVLVKIIYIASQNFDFSSVSNNVSMDINILIVERVELGKMVRCFITDLDSGCIIKMSFKLNLSV